MTKSLKIISAAVLSFMFIFIGVGYAALTTSLTISGSAEVQIPYGLFITSIGTQGTSNTDKNEFSYLDYSTTVDSTISKRTYSAGSVTYTITVFNNTDFRYAYRTVYYQSNLYDNGQIGTSNNSKIRITTSFPNGTTVNPGESLTFTATYNISAGSRWNQDQGTDYHTLVNYQFGINVDRVDQAIDVVHDKFLNILNTNTTYLQLLDALDNKFDGSQEWTSNYIGNVTNANNEDSVLVNQLFAGQLQITVGDEEYPATVLIKHENLDGNTMTGDDYVATNQNNGGVFRGYGCEMTLYLTIDPLTSAGSYVPVHAAVFTCDRDENGNKISEWYPVGDMYSGTANVVTYNGGNGTGSFVTDNWRSDAASYTPVKGYTYTVNQGTTIKDLVKVVDPNAIAAFQNLLNRAKVIIDNRDYAGTGIIAIEEMLSGASDFYTTDASGNMTAIDTTTRVRLIPIMKEFEHAIEVAEEAIKEAGGVIP